MGEMADYALDQVWNEPEYEEYDDRRHQPTKKELMAIVTRRPLKWWRRRLVSRSLQKFTNKDFAIALGRKTLLGLYWRPNRRV